MIELSGGKTAPLLLEDLSYYDPRRSTSTGFNHLTNLPRQYEDGSTPTIPWYKNQCQHKWAVKDSQCNLPLIIGRPDPKIVSTVAAFCEHCRCHLELSIDFRGGGDSPCPSDESPLHHFKYQPNLSRPRQKSDNALKSDSPHDWEDLTWFQCSTVECSAKLRIRIRSPRLRTEWVELLTDKSLIKLRAEKAISDNPERFEGHAVPLPSDVLSNLRTYILNSLKDPTRRKIPANNKKWLLSLGEPCLELLEYIGFKREDDSWLVPQPDTSESPPISDPVNVLLDDVEKELLALLLQRPDDERRAIKVQYALSPATRDLSRVLGTVNYKQKSSARTASSQELEHPFLPTLGAKSDFHDDLIRFAYERQLVTDPDGVPYYLESLQGIAEGRKSDELQTLVAIEASSGKVSAHDIRNAYKLLDLDFGSAFLDEDFIIGSFQSRAADAPRQEPDLRRALQIVGQHRSSQRIQSIASKSVTNYEQALSWLGATSDMSDEFIVTMYNVKADDNQPEEATARRAVSLIAQHRKSAALKHWVETGVLGEIEMDVGQAYNRLQIDDRTISDDFVLTAFETFYQESPSQVDDLRSALKAIAKDRNSQTLLSFLDSGMATTEYPFEEWPVGLANIGNTCYLNSLLQFYFTMKPLRELVLEFDEHKMDLTAENLVKKVVGSRKISRQEVQRAQTFVYGLQKLFRSMITANRAHVSPELELARLTLVTQPLEAALRRRSTTTGNRPSLGEIQGRPVIGPLPPSIPEAATNDAEAAGPQVNGINRDTMVDNSSEGTLLGNDQLVEAIDEEMVDLNSEPLQRQQQQILDNKENLPPAKDAPERPATPESYLKPLEEASVSRMNAQHPPAQGNHALPHPSSRKKSDPAGIASPPSREPPLPPRPQTEDQKQAMVEEVQLGAQQDVTEVISNVLFQLECAVEAEEFDPTGEQIDLVKQLFFGKQRSYTSNPQGILRTKEQFFSNLIVDVASGPKDIYEALDGAFDEQEVEVDGSLRPQYTTITRLPPVLKIMVQRVQYDQKKATAFKSTNHLGLRETIYMERYMDSEDDDLIQRRKESWGWKRQLRRLEARRSELASTELGLDMPDILSATKEYLDQLSEDDAFEVSVSLREDVEKAAEEAKKELASTDARIKDLTANINSQFVDKQGLPYRLQSVFIHVGSATFGHYWIYIRDFKKDMWRKYNDESVSQVTQLSQIFDQETSDRPPTPYFLVYVRDDVKDQVVEPVCRNVPEQQEQQQQERPTPESTDTVMSDTINDNAEPASSQQEPYQATGEMVN